eukprot:761500-Hanusia_phi.AAC.1
MIHNHCYHHHLLFFFLHSPPHLLSFPSLLPSLPPPPSSPLAPSSPFAQLSSACDCSVILSFRKHAQRREMEHRAGEKLGRYMEKEDQTENAREMKKE